MMNRHKRSCVLMFVFILTISINMFVFADVSEKKNSNLLDDYYTQYQQIIENAKVTYPENEFNLIPKEHLDKDNLPKPEEVSLFVNGFGKSIPTKDLNIPEDTLNNVARVAGLYSRTKSVASDIGTVDVKGWVKLDTYDTGSHWAIATGGRMVNAEILTKGYSWSSTPTYARNYYDTSRTYGATAQGTIER